MFLPMMLSYKISWIETQWTVIHVNISGNGDSKTYSPLVKYDCWNEKDIIWTSVVSVVSYEYRVGQRIILYCKEKDPKYFLPELPMNNVFLWVGILWLIILIPWIYKLRKSKKIKELGQELKQFGKKVEATVVDIMYVWNVGEDDSCYKIKAKYLDNEFISEKIVGNVNFVLKEWDKIDVYLDYWDSSKYWMDIDSVFEKPVDNTTIIG